MRQSVITWKELKKKRKKKSQVMKFCFESALRIKKNLTPSYQQPLQHLPTNRHASALGSWAILTLSTNRLKKMNWWRLGHPIPSLTPAWAHCHSKRPWQNHQGEDQPCPNPKGMPCLHSAGESMGHGPVGEGSWGWKSESWGIVIDHPMDTPEYQWRAHSHAVPKYVREGWNSGSCLRKNKLP